MFSFQWPQSRSHPRLRLTLASFSNVQLTDHPCRLRRTNATYQKFIISKHIVIAFWPVPSFDVAKRCQSQGAPSTICSYLHLEQPPHSQRCTQTCTSDCTSGVARPDLRMMGPLCPVFPVTGQNVMSMAGTRAGCHFDCHWWCKKDESSLPLKRELR